MVSPSSSTVGKLYELQEKATSSIFEPAKWHPEHKVAYTSIGEKELNLEMPKLL
jgi:hypothetical protein